LIRVFVGFDPRETVAWHVLAHSILARASEPVSLVPLALCNLQRTMWRDRDPLQSTDFSFSRFLVPYLSEFAGWSIYLDCDMLMRDDIASLWALREERYAVMCVKHEHVPAESTKFLGQAQSTYDRKNWSSVMLFNNDRCRMLTPQFVNSASGLVLHQFRWLLDDDLIGAIPPRWNHLVGHDLPDAFAGNVHFTAGGPYFDSYAACEYASEWFAEREAMLATLG
jgi:hypothetical protein